jgi:hypothetical protein
MEVIRHPLKISYGGSELPSSIFDIPLVIKDFEPVFPERYLFNS